MMWAGEGVSLNELTQRAQAVSAPMATQALANAQQREAELLAEIQHLSQELLEVRAIAVGYQLAIDQTN